jgi:NADH-quinone oxidoreductase subunit N
MVLGAIASALLLYGISMVYGATGSLVYSDIFFSIKSSAYNPVIMLLGIVFIIAGLSFKLGLVPFHMWAPDVYEGSNTATTLIVSTIPKIAIVVLVFRLFADVFYDISSKYIVILQTIAIVSLFVANLTAIMQTNIKRMLAYSTISHIAFVMLSLVSSYVSSNVVFATQASMFYIVSYAFSGMAVFAILLGLSNSDDNLTLDSLKGLAKKNPIIGFGLLICMFSLAGIPPTVGFYAKLLVIQGLVHTHQYILAVMAVVSSVIAAFYYLRIVKVIYFDDVSEQLPEFVQTKSAKVFMTINFSLILILGIYPKLLVSLFQNLIR